MEHGLANRRIGIWASVFAIEYYQSSNLTRKSSRDNEAACRLFDCPLSLFEVVKRPGPQGARPRAWIVEREDCKNQKYSVASRNRNTDIQAKRRRMTSEKVSPKGFSSEEKKREGGKREEPRGGK